MKLLDSVIVRFVPVRKAMKRQLIENDHIPIIHDIYLC